MRVNRIVFLLCIFLVMPTTFVAAAANNQGLDWGFEVGDTFDFTFSMEADMSDVTLSVSEDFTLNCTSLPTIPDDIDSLNDLMVLSPTFEVVEAGDEVIIGLYALYLIAFPVGNWAVITEAYNADLADMTAVEGTTIALIDTATTWGYTMTLTVDESTSVAALHISKTDGLLNYMNVRMDETDGDEFMEMTILREGYDPTALAIDPVILIAVVGGVIAVVLIVVLMKKK